MAKREFKDARLFRRGKSRFIWTRLPGGRRESTKCTSERAAVAYANRREREIADPRIARSQATRWDDAVIALLDELRRRGRSPATIDKNERKLAHYPRVWGSLENPAVDMAIGDIDADKVNAYIDQRLSEGVKRITIRDELVALGQLLKLQRRAKRYPHDVAEVLPVQWETGHKPRQRWLTREEYPKLWAALPAKRRPYLDYSIAIGGRMSEVARARHGDVGVLSVLVRGSKTEAAWQHIPITEITRPLIDRATRCPAGVAEIFIPGAPMFAPWANINRDLKKACAKAGIPPVSTNDLRRTFAQWHAEAGIEPSLLAPMLRHTTDKLAQTTYGKTNTERVGRLVAERLAGVPSLHGDQQRAPRQQHQPQTENTQNTGESAPPAEVESATSALGKPGEGAETPGDMAPEHGGVSELDGAGRDLFLALENVARDPERWQLWLDQVCSALQKARAANRKPCGPCEGMGTRPSELGGEEPCPFCNGTGFVERPQTSAGCARPHPTAKQDPLRPVRRVESAADSDHQPAGVAGEAGNSSKRAWRYVGFFANREASALREMGALVVDARLAWQLRHRADRLERLAQTPQTPAPARPPPSPTQGAPGAGTISFREIHLTGEDGRPLVFRDRGTVAAFDALAAIHGDRRVMTRGALESAAWADEVVARAEDAERIHG